LQGGACREARRSVNREAEQGWGQEGRAGPGAGSPGTAPAPQPRLRQEKGARSRLPKRKFHPAQDFQTAIIFHGPIREERGKRTKLGK